MKVIVDANILFAALIKDSKTSSLFFVDKFDLYAPEFIFEEYEKYEEAIRDKTGRSNDEFEKYLKFLKRKINIVPENDFKDLLEECSSFSPGPKDVPYLALAKKIKAVIWSNDKKLKVNQDRVEVLTTQDLITYLP